MFVIFIPEEALNGILADIISALCSFTYQNLEFYSRNDRGYSVADAVCFIGVKCAWILGHSSFSSCCNVRYVKWFLLKSFFMYGWNLQLHCVGNMGQLVAFLQKRSCQPADAWPR